MARGAPLPKAKQVWRVGLDSGAIAGQDHRNPVQQRRAVPLPRRPLAGHTADESGRDEVYVRSYPGAGGRWQVSLEGGTERSWSAKGGEIFYRSGDDMMAAAVRPCPRGGPDGRASSRDSIRRPDPDQNYSVSSDGKTFAMMERVTARARRWW